MTARRRWNSSATTTNRRCRSTCAGPTWATDDEGITGDALLDFVNNTLLPKLKALTGGGDKIAGAHPHDLRGCQQLHEERHADAAGHQQDQRHRLQRLR